jgi:molecular chaperone GrpE (heat shock protein)
MFNRFGRREDAVPLEVARRIHAEREAAMGQLEVARADAAKLRHALQQREEEHRVLVQTARGLQAELARARTECEALRARLASAEEDIAAQTAAHTAADAELGDVHRSDPDGGRVQELLEDIANLRRRRTIDLEAGQRTERVRLLGRLAEVRESVMWGLGTHPDVSSPWYTGLVAIRDQLDAQLHAEGARLTGRVGEPFDPRVHEGIGTLARTGLPAGVVARVESQGLVLDDGTVVRPARVSVAG